MFPALVDAGRTEDIHVVWNKEGEVVGATVAALSSEDGEEGPMHQSLAWPITLGEFSGRMTVMAELIPGSRCGVIACVGVAASTRGSGAGVAVVASATQNLIDRGADECFIDWVDMDGFYEKCGYTKWEKAYSGAWL
jgi:beta-N-acetylhexosaminidase